MLLITHLIVFVLVSFTAAKVTYCE